MLGEERRDNIRNERIRGTIGRRMMELQVEVVRGDALVVWTLYEWR